MNGCEPGAGTSIDDAAKPAVLIFGPARSAVSGVSTHLNQLFGSSLDSEFLLTQFQVGSEGRSETRLRKLIRLIASPLGLAVRIARQRPDIIHLNTSLEPKSFWRDLVYLTVGKLMGRRTVYQIHGGELPGAFFTGRLGTALLRWTLGLPDAVVVLAQCEAQAYKNFAPIKRLTIAPNAVDLAEFDGMPRKLFDAPKLVLGYIGRFAEDKGMQDIFEALAILKDEKAARLDLHLAGAGPAEPAMKSAIARYGLDGQATFLGPIAGREKTAFWQRTDIFVFPTYHREGLPYTVLESLASGTPMITTRVGGIPDAVVSGVHGYFVQPKDPRELAEAIWRAVDDRQWLRAASLRCREQANAHYGIERLVGQFKAIYRSVLN